MDEIPNAEAVELMTNTLFSEAYKSEKDIDEMMEDAHGIANVISTRKNNPKRFGETLDDVVYAPNQFSGVGGDEWQKAVDKNFTESEANIYKKFRQMAYLAVQGKLEDITGGADHYYNPELASPDWGKLTTPSSVEQWNYYYKPVFKSKKHHFFKETLRKK